MTPEKLAILKAELIADPTGMGLVNDAEHDDANQQLLNAVNPEIEVDRVSVSIAEYGLSPQDYAALDPGNREWYDNITRSGSVKPSVVRGYLDSLFEGTETQASYRVAFVRHGSRAEQLGLGTIFNEDVAAARIS